MRYCAGLINACVHMTTTARMSECKGRWDPDDSSKVNNECFSFKL